MSTFDDASLVFIPSGYKTSKAYSVKPSDGSGDLTFSRSNDTATRVGPDGLIEKVRTNLILQSQTLDNASWTKSASSVTANTTTAPDGTSTADTWTADGTAATHGIIQSGTATLTNGTTYSTSIYAKKGTNDFIQIIGSSSPYGSLNVFANFDLNNGVVGTVGSLVTATIQDAGNGWYRCTMIAAAAATTSTNTFIVHIVSSASAARGESNSLSTSVFLWGAQLEVSDFGATDYIATTSAAVSVGPVANVPRLDYLNSSCPRLLLEPQRTNLAWYSEQFNNAVWQSNLFGNWSTATVTANTATAPDGTLSADTIALTSPVSNALQRISVSANTTYTYTVYVKAPASQNYNGQLVLRVTTGNSNTLVNENFQVVNISSLVSTTEWKRFDITFTVPSTGVNQVEIGISALNATSINATVYAWGAQLEAGAYATSYIPTLGAAVTRGADACSKTGISSLIGQTEGVLFVDFVLNGQQNNANILNSEKNTTQAFFMAVQTDGDFDAGLYVGGSLVGRIQWPAGITIGQRYKVAYAYKSGSFALYINGVQSGTLSSTFTPVTTFDDIFLNDPTTYFNYQENVSFNQALLFKTRLSNSSLAELTSL